MDAIANITTAVFAAYLKCPTKAYLTAHGENPPDTFVADTRQGVSAAYKIKAGGGVGAGFVPFDFLQLGGDRTREVATLFVDCETASFTCDRPALARIGHQAGSSERRCDFVPILYSAWDTSDQSNDLLVCFGALAIGQATGSGIPPSGKVVYGEGYRGKTVRIADHVPKTRQVMEAIAALCQASEPPPLVLNKHCPACDFQLRCRTLAIERDDLSLLGAMTAKERIKCEENGISTITQLSYGYRPRRRRRIKPAAPAGSPPAKPDHKLKALAIKKAQIHVVGSPSLSIEGTPVFMDVEGMPDRDFYYLIGLRHETQGTPVEQSFWADGPENECDIWRECLRALKHIDNPRIVHYGAYETRFLKHMKERWKPNTEDAEFVDRIVEGSVNLLASMYGRIYFPTYSNGLKEVARWLGFAWTWPQSSGTAAILLRRCWELTHDDGLRRTLITYNMEDCGAAAVVAESLAHICADSESNARKFETVNVGSLEVGFQRTFGKFTSVLPEFEKINSAAYWNYQRSRVYIRSDKTIRRSVEKTVKPIKKLAVKKEVALDDRPVSCSRCGEAKVRIAKRMSRVVLDLKFTRGGITRRVVRYRYNSYRCAACKAEMTLHPRATKYGPSLRAYIAYLLIEMRLSNEKIREHVVTVFDVPITTTLAHDTKALMAKTYEPTYRRILEQIASGPFTRLRNVMITSTPKGTREYCILLTLQQTLRCRGISFLDFLQSGRMEIDYRLGNPSRLGLDAEP